MKNNPDISELILRCRKGCRRAQYELYEKFAPKMFAVCLRYARDASEAEDMLQDGFIKVFANLGSFKDLGSFEGWVRRIFVNTALEKFRKKNPMLLSSELHPNLAITRDDETVLNRLSAEELTRLIRSLPDGYRMVFNLYAVEGYSHKEIGEMLSISEGTSKSQLARARQHLQEKIRTELPEYLPVTNVM